MSDMYDIHDDYGTTSFKEKEIKVSEKPKVMSDVVGKIEVVAPNKVGFYNVKIGNDWYGTGSKNKPAFDRGDTIEFDVEETVKDGRTFKNMRNPKVVAEKAAPAPAAAYTGPKTAPAVDWDLKDRKIQQQSARNAALTFINILAQAGSIVYKKDAKEKDKIVVLEGLLEHYTEKFLSDTGAVGTAAVDPKAQSADDLSGEES